MSLIEQLNDTDYEQALLPVWEYLVVEHIPQRSDVIFVFGGIDLAVPAKAAELYLANLAPHVLISGNVGPFTKEIFSEPEAYVFKQEMTKMGVPESSIKIEDQASNTGENVTFGMRNLADRNIIINSAILVAKPFLARRCLATFQLHYPKVTLFCCPPKGPILKFCDRPRHDFAGRLLAEIDRLELYYKKGYITKQIIPHSVKSAAEQIRNFID